MSSQYPDAEQIVLVLDQRNTHTPASLYTALAPAKAKRLTERLEIHDTPKQASWLNMAELDLGVGSGNACANDSVIGQRWRRPSRLGSRDGTEHHRGSTGNFRADARISCGVSTRPMRPDAPLVRQDGNRPGLLLLLA